MEEILVTTGSGNVFADLGLDDADDLLARADLGIAVRRLTQERHYSVNHIAELFNLTLAEATDLENGRFDLFSESELLGFLRALDQQVTISIAPRPAGQSAFVVMAS